MPNIFIESSLYNAVITLNCQIHCKEFAKCFNGNESNKHSHKDK